MLKLRKNACHSLYLRDFIKEVCHIIAVSYILFPCLGHSEVPMLSERYPSEPPHGAVAFYPAYGAKPDLPIYVPRGAHPPGPPPLLASKRDGPETHMLPAFYPSPYPPPVSL